jgi:hypothetical protein
MYCYNEIRVIFANCRNDLELEKVCEAFLIIIEDGDFSQELEDYTRAQAHFRFRALKQ